MPGLKGAVEADPGFALAHAVNGLVLYGARAVGRSDKLQKLLDL